MTNKIPYGFTINGDLISHNSYEFLTVAKLKAIIADLPDECPILMETSEWPYLERAEEADIRPISAAENYRALDAVNFEDADRNCAALFIR